MTKYGNHKANTIHHIIRYVMLKWNSGSFASSSKTFLSRFTTPDFPPPVVGEATLPRRLLLLLLLGSVHPSFLVPEELKLRLFIFLRAASLFAFSLSSIANKAFRAEKMIGKQTRLVKKETPIPRKNKIAVYIVLFLYVATHDAW